MANQTGSGILTFPKITLLTTTVPSCSGTMEFPSPLLEGHGIAGTVGRNGTHNLFPVISLVGRGGARSEDLVFPMPWLVGSASIEKRGDAILSFPRITLIGRGLVGIDGEGINEFPLPMFTGHGYISSIHGSALMTFPAPALEGDGSTSDRYDDYVLKFRRWPSDS